MAYLYRHVRNDKNEPFYIGIGSDEEGSFIRAYDKQKRNRFWKFIIKKTPYDIEILMDGLIWEEAEVKEIEFVKLYGRRDLGLGSLVNLTDGGGGCPNRSPESIAKSVANTDYKLSSEKRKKPILQYSIEGNFIMEWKSVSDASCELKISLTHINDCCRRVIKSSGGFIWRYKDEDKWFEPIYQSNFCSPESILKRSKKLKKSVLQYDLNGNLIKEWDSAIDATKFFTKLKNDSRITACCNGRAVSAFNFIWRHKDPSKWFEPEYINGWYDEEYKKMKAERARKTVLQFDKNNTLIKEWSCIKDAAEFYDIPATNISACCRGRQKSAANSLWEYKKIIDNG